MWNSCIAYELYQSNRMEFLGCNLSVKYNYIIWSNLWQTAFKLKSKATCWTENDVNSRIHN